MLIMLSKIILTVLVLLNMFSKIKKVMGYINNASEKVYNTMYTMACAVVLFLTIIDLIIDEKHYTIDSFKTISYSKSLIILSSSNTAVLLLIVTQLAPIPKENIT